MVIISKTVLLKFADKHPMSVSAINSWYSIAKSANWSSIADLKTQFNNVDFVGNDRFVFNIKGNDYRLVAMIFFDKRTIFIRFIGTHSMYDQIDCKLI